MIYQENVSLILTLCNLVEGGRSKCEKYWTEENETCTYTSKENMSIEISTIKVETLGKFLLKRTIKLTLENKSREVVQFHYMGWPDHDVPSGESMKEFQLVINIFTEWLLLNTDNNFKSIVHCSAGIGRTGTTIGLAHL